MCRIRRCRGDERGEILAIVNAAAEAYRGVIPADRWHEPYMPMNELEREIAAGVQFYGYTVVSHADKEKLLRSYWSIPARQVENSVVLADRRWMQVR
jgi:hypothetical protein